LDVNEVALEKVPLGAVQVALDAPPPMLAPDRVTVPPAHTDCALPALTVALGDTTIVLLPVAAVQPAGTLVVNIKVTVPVKLAAGV